MDKLQKIEWFVYGCELCLLSIIVFAIKNYYTQSMNKFIKYLIHKITIWITVFFPSFLFKRDFTRIVYMHNPAPKVLDEILSALELIAPFTTYNEIMEANKTLPNGYVITFDDGFKQNIALLDVLDKHNCKAVFFVSTGTLHNDKPLWCMNKEKSYLKFKEELKTLDYKTFLLRINEMGLTDINHEHGRYGLTTEELVQIAKRGHAIGVHTVNHVFLSKLTPDELKYEIGQSYDALKKALNDNELPFDVAYPDGDYSQTVINVLEEMSCRSAVTIEHEDVSMNNSCYQIGRYGAADNDYAGYVLFKQSKLYRFLKARR